MDIAKSFRTGILYNALGKYSNVIIQLLVTSILSRMLTPKEYGLVAVVNVFLIFFQMIADSGIGPAIIQEKSLTKQDIQHIFSLTVPPDGKSHPYPSVPASYAYPLPAVRSDRNPDPARD